MESQNELFTIDLDLPDPYPFGFHPFSKAVFATFIPTADRWPAMDDIQLLCLVPCPATLVALVPTYYVFASISSPNLSLSHLLIATRNIAKTLDVFTATRTLYIALGVFIVIFGFVTLGNRG